MNPNINDRLNVAIVGFVISGLLIFIATYMKPSLDAQQSVPQKAAPINSAEWQRMKDCAELADRVLERKHILVKHALVGETVQPPAVIDVNNHYSPTFQRCYLSVANMAKDGSIYSELFDALENRLLSQCRKEEEFYEKLARKHGAINLPPSLCYIDGVPDSKGDCNKCRDFMNERMNH